MPKKTQQEEKQETREVTLYDILDVLKNLKNQIDTNTRAIQVIAKRLDTHDQVLQQLPQLLSKAKTTGNPGTPGTQKMNLMDFIMLLKELGGGDNPMQKMFEKYMWSTLKLGYMINKKILTKLAGKESFIKELGLEFEEE